jgi:hypothetical protein
MPLALAGPRSGFTFEEFFERFSIRHQICLFYYFSTFCDCGDFNCDNWINNWLGNLVFNNLGSKSEYKKMDRIFLFTENTLVSITTIDTIDNFFM